MPQLFQTITDLRDGTESLRRRRYGVIEVADGRFRRVLLRPFPKVVSPAEILLLGELIRRRPAGDCVRLYYNQPRRFPSFLVLKYIVSGRQTRYATLRRAMAALDEIARLKQSDALLCDVANGRISRRLMARAGWQPHCPSRWHRHYIKRLYPRDVPDRLAQWRPVVEAGEAVNDRS